MTDSASVPLTSARPVPPPPSPSLSRFILPVLAVTVTAVLVLHTVPSFSLSPFARADPIMHSSDATTANNLGLRLFATVAATRPNALLSPVSISRVLSLTAAGTTPGSNASAELAKLLPKSAPPPAVPRDITLTLASAVWLGKSVKSDYVTTARSLGADARSQPKSVDEVNAWVRSATKGAIPSVLESLPSPLVALLVDAVYFRAMWTTSFDKKNSKRREFGNVGEVMMMRSAAKAEFSYAVATAGLGDQRTVQVAELPYGKTSEYSAVVVLPAEDMELNDVVKAVGQNPGLWDSWTGALAKTKLDLLSLPRFKLEFGVESLKSTLQTLGVRAAFVSDKKQPPLSRMTDDPDAYLDDVLHKAAMEVSEEGTVASAVSAAVVMTRSLPVPGPAMIVNRPFLIAVRHVQSGLVLFMGRVDKPIEP